MAISSGNQAHDIAALNSDMLLQQALGPDRLQDRSFPSTPGQVSVFAPPLSAAAVRAATVAHYRRLISSALANNLSVAPYLQALQSLGASLYG